MIQRQTIHRLVGPGAALLMASMFLGVIYNAASPLGVRSSSPGGAEKRATPFAETVANVENETISISLLSPTAPPRSTRIYQNETISLSLNWPQAVGVVKPVGNSTIAGPTAAGTPTQKAIPSVTWREVKPLVAANQVVLVDARVAAQYQAGHIPGAQSLAAGSPSSELAAFAQKYPKTTPLVIYCGTERCPMAHDLGETLIGQYGYGNVRVMPGGYAEYRLAQAQSSTEGAVK